MSKRFGLYRIFLAIFLLCTALPLSLFCAPLDNQQDEYVLFNRDLAPDIEEFKILRTDDKFEINRYVTRAWELKHANAYELLPHLKKAVEAEKGKVRTLKYKDVEAGKTRYFIQVVAPDFQISSIEELIKTLDLPGVESSEGDIKFNYRLLYRDAEEMANLIKNSPLHRSRTENA